jgi:hypothetical protein
MYNCPVVAFPVLDKKASPVTVERMAPEVNPALKVTPVGNVYAAPAPKVPCTLVVGSICEGNRPAAPIFVLSIFADHVCIAAKLALNGAALMVVPVTNTFGMVSVDTLA